MKKIFLSLCFVTLFGAGLSSCSDDAAEFVPTQQKELSAPTLMTEDETRTKKP